MIRGRVNSAHEALIEVDFVCDGTACRSITVILDTGFNGALTLPAAEIAALRLPLVGNRSAALADGSIIVLDVYLATIDWHDQDRDVLVLQSDAESLAGMDLLKDCRLTIDIQENGEVAIVPLS